MGSLAGIIAAMRGEHAKPSIQPEDVLNEAEYQVLMRARRGELSCPWCGNLLVGRFFFRIEAGEQLQGVQLNCPHCKFEEY